MKRASIARTAAARASDDEIGWNLASMRSPEPGSCEVQTMLAQRVEGRRGLDESFDRVGKPEVIVGARRSMRGGRAMPEFGRHGGRRMVCTSI